MRNDKLYAAIINGKETKFEADPTADEYSSRSIESMAKRIVREAGMTTQRNNPQSVVVRVNAIELKDGELVQRYVRTFNIVPPLTRMTAEEYTAEQTEALAEVPAEFHGALSSMAYEHGHSAGHEEVINTLRSLIGDLLPSIKAYGFRVANEAAKMESLRVKA